MAYMPNNGFSQKECRYVCDLALRTAVTSLTWCMGQNELRGDSKAGTYLRNEMTRGNNNVMDSIQVQAKSLSYNLKGCHSIHPCV